MKSRETVWPGICMIQAEAAAKSASLHQQNQQLLQKQVVQSVGKMICLRNYIVTGIDNLQIR